MQIADVNPHIRYARLHAAVFHTQAEFSICYDCRMFFAELAEGSITIGNQKYEISNGTAIFLPPGTKYRLQFQTEKDFKIIILDFDLSQRFSHIKSSLGTAKESNFLPEKVLCDTLPETLTAPVLKSVPKLSHTLTQCTNYFLTKNTFFREKSSALLKLALIELIQHNEQNLSHSSLCREVLRFIRENYADHTLTNAKIAESFNYHPYHLSRILSAQTGKTLHKNVIDYRLAIAKNDLLTTTLDIDQIAWKTGFSSSAYFIKTFREHVGITPKKYRRVYVHTEL